MNKLQGKIYLREEISKILLKLRWGDIPTETIALDDLSQLFTEMVEEVIPKERTHLPSCSSVKPYTLCDCGLIRVNVAIDQMRQKAKDLVK